MGWAAIGTMSLVFLGNGCALFEDERTTKGRKLYNHYCMHCHGESGRQNEGFNWGRMPDPRPRDLSEEAAMSTFSDEEIFNAISREMRDTTDQAVLDDENYFAVSTMPTFKYTLSEEEIWSVVGYVRTLHGMSLTYDLDSRRSQLDGVLQTAKQELDQEMPVLEAAEQKLSAAEEALAVAEEEEMEDENADDEMDVEEDEEEEEDVVLPEEIALEEAQAKFDQIQTKYDQAKAALDNLTKRPRHSQISRPDLTLPDEERAKLEETGKSFYLNKYGCNSCHSINDEGGLVGPALDRAGFRLNATWVYRWIRYPQGMKKHTRMPNLGVNDQDAKALTAYLETLRATKPDQPIPPPE